MTAGFKVSKATKEDAFGISEVSFEVAKEGIVKEFKPEEMAKILSSELYYVAVAKLDEEVIGYAMSTYSWGKLHILDIAVRRDKRRMGIGKALIEHLIRHAVEMGLPEAYCEVRAENVPALNLFTGSGFRFRAFFRLVGGFYGLYLPLKAVEERLSSCA